MPSDALNAVPPPLRPSVFLSYASADRAAARALRDTLEAAGLDVWLDEEELGGGEAWDLKIRTQIRTCTYFMPIISATTEIRREGYFRREWRLAVERTLDLADDVMFLVPIVIDTTRDVGARVPEKFFSVQWLRVPGGQATPQFRGLAQKLAADDAMAHPPTPVLAPIEHSDRKARAVTKGPPPFPHIPPFPEPGDRLRFCYELIPWSGRMLHALWVRLPKWTRPVVAVMITFSVVDGVFSDRSATRKNDETATAREIAKAAVEAAAHLRVAEVKTSSADWIRLVVDESIKGERAGRPLVVVNFSSNDKDTGSYTRRLFASLIQLLRKNPENEFSISASPLPEDFDDDDALDRGTKLESDFVLTGLAEHPAVGQGPKFTAKLYNVKQGAVVWTETYDTVQVDAAAAAARLADGVRRRAFPSTKP